MTLAPTKAMTREEIAEALDIIERVSKAVEALPYSEAIILKSWLEDELKDMIYEQLPGGYFGKCEACDVVIGNDDDIVMNDDGCHFCLDCIDRWNKEQTA